MTVEVIGSYPPITRLQTGFYSLDRAFINDLGEIGIPIGHCWEIVGTSGTGKSTFAKSLAGIIATIQQQDIILCDFEGFDPKFLTRILSGVGFSGKINTVRNGEDEEQIDEMVEKLRDDDYCVAILDSVSAISPIGEQQGDIGEANMGRRAFIMAQLTRRASHVFRFADKNNPKTLLLLNHWLPKIGSRGYISPGGEAKEFMITNKVVLKRIEEFPDGYEKTTGSYVLQGEVKKNRWGYEDRKFYAFMLAGRGMHKGLTALYDCVIMKNVEYKNGVVKMGGNSLGRMSTFVKEAKIGNNEIFSQFYQALAENTDSGNEQEQDFTGTTDIPDD
jgi:RecA/RadA recombinase